MNLDRPTLIAALVTLALAAPVYLFFEWVIMPHANPAPEITAPDVALAPAPAAAPVESLPVASLAGASLTGLIVDADGAPLPGRSLLLQASDHPGQMLHVTGDERGRFRVEDAPTGRLTFTTRTNPHHEVQGPQLSPASDLDVLLVLDEGIHMLSGLVVGDRGEPVAGAQLKLSWTQTDGDLLSSSTRTAVTDAVGAFFFTELGPGMHQLVASAEGYHEAHGSYDVSSDSKEVELRLRSNPARGPRPIRPRGGWSQPR